MTQSRISTPTLHESKVCFVKAGAQLALTFLACFIASPASATSSNCPTMLFGPIAGRQGIADLQRYLAASDAVIIGEMTRIAAGSYAIKIDRILKDKMQSKTVLQLGSSIPVNSCLLYANYGIFFIKASSDGAWQVFNAFGVGLPALPRPPANQIRAEPTLRLTEELTNTLTATKYEAEDQARGFTLNFASGTITSSAEADGNPVGKTVSRKVTPEIRAEMAYSNVYQNLTQIGDDRMVLKSLLNASSNTKTELARIWAGVMLLNFGDFSKADPALKLLMTPCLTHPLLVQAFGYNGGVDGLRYILVLAKSKNVVVRRTLADAINNAAESAKIMLNDSASREIVATSIGELTRDPDADVRETAMMALCKLVDDCKASMGLPANASYDAAVRNPDAVAKLVAAIEKERSKPIH